MLSGKVFNTSVFAAVLLASLMLPALATAAGKEKTIHAFGHGADGGGPTPTLLADSSGNLYGTAFGGGSHGAGTVFELSRNRVAAGANARSTRFSAGPTAKFRVRD